MKRIVLLLAFSLTTIQLPAQDVVAIVTMRVTNPTDTNARFVIDLDPANAPRSVAQLVKLADPSPRFYRKNGSGTLTNNPAGIYDPSDADGFPLGGANSTYSISVNNATRPFASNVSLGTVATVTRNPSGATVATLVRGGSGWIHQRGDFEPYQFSLAYNSSMVRWILNVEIDLPYLNPTTSTLTSGPFYNSGSPIPAAGGSFPFLTIGERGSSTAPSPGWVLPNEIINRSVNTLTSNSVFGNHFANTIGIVTNAQRYAVAFANEDLITPNTAGSQLLVTGFNGNPNFEGRHTYIGDIFLGTYINREVVPNTVVSNSRGLVDSLLNGSRSATLTSIDIETSGSFPFLPIDGARTTPTPEISSSCPRLDFPAPDSPLLLTGSSRGQIRLVETSPDLRNWLPAGQSSFPPNALAEAGFSSQRNLARQFYRVNPLAVTYPSFPSQLLNLINTQIRLRGLIIDSNSGPQSLNDVTLSLGSSGQSGTLTGTGGDLAGSHSLSEVNYAVTGPYEGVLSMESPSFSDPLKFRLYFEPEYSGGMIARYHRLVPASAGSNVEVKNEYGVWRTDE